MKKCLTPTPAIDFHKLAVSYLQGGPAEPIVINGGTWGPWPIING